MPRPSQLLDQALLASGRELFAERGCAGLSLRGLAEHAGVNPGMFHYHFKSKDKFLRLLLQQLYEEMFAGLQAQASHAGPALDRLRAALLTFAGFARANRRVVARLWIDAMAGEPVVLRFMKDNAPRHIGLLAGLLQAAQDEGALPPQPALQRFMFLAGAVVLPMIFVAGIADTRLAPVALRQAFDQQVMSDAAIAQRITWALQALTAAGPSQTPKTQRAKPAPRAQRQGA